MASDPKWYDSADAPLGSVAPQLSGDAGTPSATPVTLRLYNDKDGAGADTLLPSQLYGLARTSSSGQGVTSGHPLVDRRMVEARITQGLGGKTVPAGAWTGLGDGAFLALPSLASGEGVEIQFQLDAPMDAQGDNLFLVLSLAIETATSLGSGLSEIAGDGVYLGIGNPLTSSILIGEDVVENPAGADTQVRVGTFAWIGEGRIYSRLQALTSIAASTAGTRRYVLLSLASDGSLVATDGAETAAVLTDDDKPDTPVDNEPIAYVRRDDTAVIDSTDIDNVWQRAGYHVSSSGLNAAVGAGKGLVDNSLTFNQTTQSASLTASTTNHLWLLRSGQLAVTVDGEAPDGTRALLLAELDTDASAVTALRDRRRFIGFRLHVIRFEWLGAVAAGQFRYAVNPVDRPVYIFPFRGLRAALSGSGTVSGSTRWAADVDASYDGTWTALTDPGSAPEIAFGATDPRHLDAIPVSFLIPPGARIRTQIDTVPGGGDSADGILEMLLVEV